MDVSCFVAAKVRHKTSPVKGLLPLSLEKHRKTLKLVVCPRCFFGVFTYNFFAAEAKQPTFPVRETAGQRLTFAPNH